MLCYCLCRSLSVCIRCRVCLHSYMLLHVCPPQLPSYYGHKTANNAAPTQASRAEPVVSLPAEMDMRYTDSLRDAPQAVVLSPSQGKLHCLSSSFSEMPAMLCAHQHSLRDRPGQSIRSDNSGQMFPWPPSTDERGET